MGAQPEPGPRDRMVILLMAAILGVVLLGAILTAVVPGMDRVLATLPVVGAILVGGTLLILARTIRR